MFRFLLERLALIGALAGLVIAIIWPHFDSFYSKFIKRTLISLLSSISISSSQSLSLETESPTTTQKQPKLHPSKLSGQTVKRAKSSRTNVSIVGQESNCSWFNLVTGLTSAVKPIVLDYRKQLIPRLLNNICPPNPTCGTVATTNEVHSLTIWLAGGPSSVIIVICSVWWWWCWWWEILNEWRRTSANASRSAANGSYSLRPPELLASSWCWLQIHHRPYDGDNIAHLVHSLSNRFDHLHNGKNAKCASISWRQSPPPPPLPPQQQPDGQEMFRVHRRSLSTARWSNQVHRSETTETRVAQAEQRGKSSAADPAPWRKKRVPSNKVPCSRAKGAKKFHSKEFTDGTR